MIRQDTQFTTEDLQHRVKQPRKPVPRDYQIYTAEAVGVQGVDPLGYHWETMEDYEKWWAKRVAYNESKRGTDEWIPYYRSTSPPSPRQHQASRPAINTCRCQAAAGCEAVYPGTSRTEARRTLREDTCDWDTSMPYRTAEETMKANWYQSNPATLDELHQKQLKHLHSMSDKNITIKPYKPARQFPHCRTRGETSSANNPPVTPPRHKDNVPDVITPEYLLSRLPHTPPSVFGQDVEPASPTAHLPTPQYASRPPLRLSDIATAWIPTFKARRANKLFRKTFSFSVVSQRSEADWISEISPRTSVSCNAAAAAEAAGKEQTKRQRVDSSSSGVGEFKKKRDETSVRRPSTLVAEPYMAPKPPIVSRATTMTMMKDQDMHPGRRVSFTRHSDPVTEEYHAFLAGDTSPEVESSTPIEEMRELQNGSGPISPSKDSQLNRPEQMGRKRAPTTSSTRGAAREEGSSKLIRCESAERCPSTEAALKAIRESFEKRSAVKQRTSALDRKDRKVSYGIFVDEDEKGFLGNEKL